VAAADDDAAADDVNAPGTGFDTSDVGSDAPAPADARGVGFDAAAAAVRAPGVSCHLTAVFPVAATAAPAAADAAAASSSL
jgi:hypothetical protein